MTPSQSRQTAGQSLPDSLRNCLSLDIEVSRQSGQIVAAAACNPQTGRTWRAKGPLTQQQLLELDRIAAEADHLVGHNILAFDLPQLRALHAGLGLLEMPALDTLHLNPLAFPAHPYHRLVKHYRDGGLIRTTHNDPLLDSQLTLQVLEAQLTELRENTSPELLSAWHWLTAHEAGPAFDAFFTEVRQRPVPTPEQGREALRRFLAGKACRTAARELTATAEDSAWPAAYVTAWMSTAGTNSAIPPWVLQHHPDTAALARRLREEICTDPACTWCPEMNDVVKELTRWFGFDSYRPTPADQEGRSLQERITEAALRGRSALGVLPTGTGKSLCYQVPALSAYDKTSALTVVISPLVALMADQLTGLERHGITSAVSINSLLSMPERRDALDRVMRGQASLVIISPEQLRSPSVKQALQQRLIARWVLDEAHCLSKWGHDFRPDYRYIARFIRENLGGQRPPVLCLTATAKPDVKDEIQEYFRNELDMEVELLDGGASRENLVFDVLPTKPQLKMAQVTELLEQHLGGDGGGAHNLPGQQAAGRGDRRAPEHERSCGWPLPLEDEPRAKAGDPAAVPRRQHQGDLRHQRFRHGNRQARHPAGHPRRHTGLAGELPAGGRQGRTGRRQRPLRAALRLRRHRVAARAAGIEPPQQAGHRGHAEGAKALGRSE